jgi:alcohol dehydrogenase
MRAGVALHYLDRVTTDLLGPYPYGKPFAIGHALRALSPGGVCTAVGFYFARSTGLPLMQMYANGATLQVGVSHARADLPRVIDLVKRNAFDPLKVATPIADWDDAPDAFTTRTTKVIVRRSELRRP